ncbi:hypothetical protein N9Z47_01005 [bacterium]|nr:hypothetical protein [Mariniblastus sp.]MDA7885192.1 hypothetical protein [bacterium]MDB4385918.1 hypothetical protein [bacterium]
MITSKNKEIMSWRLAVELWRRFPTQFKLIETHPGGGMYDCLTFWYLQGQGSRLQINREGSIHLSPGSNNRAKSWPDWVEQMFADRNLQLLDEIGNALELKTPQRLPRSTPTTIVFRFIAEFLTHSFGRLEKWECRNGFHDTSGYSGGIREDWFERFPTIELDKKALDTTGSSFNQAYDYWFLLRDGVPMICLNTNGTTINVDGKRADLAELYRHEKRIWKLILTVAGECLP